jgi:uncharacterized membrane protein
MTLTVTVLSILCYLRDHDYDGDASLDVGSLISPVSGLAILAAVLSLLGVLVLNLKGENHVALLAAVIIALSIAAIAASKRTDASVVIALLFVSIGLVLRSSLVSPFLWGADIQYENYVTDLTLHNSHWSPGISYSPNAMLSLAILAPFYSICSGASSIWVFKVAFPLLFSLVPLAIFCLFRDQFGPRAAFVGAVLFMAFFGFYGEMLQLAKQEIAEIFLAVLLVAMFDGRVRPIARSLMMLFFGFSMIVSHYGLSYFFLIGLIMALVVGKGLKRQHVNPERRIVSSSFVFSYVILLALWYTYVSGGATLALIVDIARVISSTFGAEFLNPDAAQGLALVVTPGVSVLHEVSKYLQIAAQLLIAIGLFSISIGRKNTMNPKEVAQKVYLTFSWIAFSMMLAAIAVPFFSSALNTTRLYQIALFFLSPFLLIGLASAMDALRRVSSGRLACNRNTLFKIAALFVAVFFIFNSGLIYEISGDHPTAITLSNKVDFARFNSQEVSCGEWLLETKGATPVYADQYRMLLLVGLGWNSTHRLPADLNKTPAESYIFLGSNNINQNMVVALRMVGTVKTTELVSSQLIVDNRSVIFDNGGARVYFSGLPS